jgi:hypothetical protein
MSQRWDLIRWWWWKNGQSWVQIQSVVMIEILNPKWSSDVI